MPLLGCHSIERASTPPSHSRFRHRVPRHQSRHEARRKTAPGSVPSGRPKGQRGTTRWAPRQRGQHSKANGLHWRQILGHFFPARRQGQGRSYWKTMRSQVSNMKLCKSETNTFSSHFLTLRGTRKPKAWKGTLHAAATDLQRPDSTARPRAPPAVSVGEDS